MVEIVTGALIGYRLVKDAKFVLSIAAYVKNYQGYNSEDNKEDDRAMRNWIMESTNGLRTHAMNLMESILAPRALFDPSPPSSSDLTG